MAQPRLQFPRDNSKHPVWTRISIHDVHNTLSDADKQMIQKGEYGSFLKQTASKKDTARTTSAKDVVHTIYLYMPSNFVVNDTNNFDQVDLGAIGSFFEGGVDKAAGLAATNKETTEMGVGKELAVMAGSSAAKSGIPGLDSLTSRALLRAGIISNPRTQMLYKSPSLRQFQFSYKLIPEDRSESDTIYEIIKILRKSAYPTITAGLGSVYQFPLTFTVDFVMNTGSASSKGSSMDKLIKLPALYCTNVSTNYNPTNPSFFADGSPTEIDLQLTFQEKEALDSAKVGEGY